MPIIQSCCCWRSLRRGCYAAASYTLIYFAVTIVTMGHFIEVEQRYLSGAMTEPESESFLEPEKITPRLGGRVTDLLQYANTKLYTTLLPPSNDDSSEGDLLLADNGVTPTIKKIGLGGRVTDLLQYANTKLYTTLLPPSNNDSSEVDLLLAVNGSTPIIKKIEPMDAEDVWHYRLTVSLNITLLACSSLGIIACIMLIVGVYKDIKFMLLPWIFAMGLETLVELINLVYLFYLQTLNFNPITSFLFTLDFFIIILNIYAMVCVISQFQEYLAGRGTTAFDYSDRMAVVQYTAAAQQTTTTSTAPSGRRRSAPRPMPSRCDPEDFSEAPTRTITSVLSKPNRSAVKKHVQFPDEQSCIEEASEAPGDEVHANSPVMSSLWMELESETHVPER